MFKKIKNFATILLLIFTFNVPFLTLPVLLSLFPTIVHAQGTPPTNTTPIAGPSVDDLLHPAQPSSTDPGLSKIDIVSNIAKNTSQDWTVILANIIKFALSITGALAFISFTAAGVLLVTARGSEDQIKKGKDILIWSIIGLAIIATAYALVLGVSLIQF